MLSSAIIKRLVSIVSVSICFAFAGGTARGEVLQCSAEYKGVYHNLTLNDKNGKIVAFSYVSSVRTPGLATNCTVDESAAQEAPVVRGDSTIYHMIGDDVLTIKKNSMGWSVDMNNLTTFNYCNGILAKQVSIERRKKHCRVVSDGAPIPE